MDEGRDEGCGGGPNMDEGRGEGCGGGPKKMRKVGQTWMR